MNTFIHARLIFFLKEYFRVNWIDFCPIDVIGYIMMINYVHIKISCDYDHIFTIINGKFSLWKKNYALPDRNYSQIQHPIQLKLINIKSIKSDNRNNIFFLTDVGNIYRCDYTNELIKFPYVKITKIKYRGSNIIMLGNDNIWYDGSTNINDCVSHAIFDSSYIKKISCGDRHYVALSTLGKLYSWGDAYYTGHGYLDSKILIPRQLALSNVITFDCGEDHTVALSGGEIYVWGSNAQKQLGLRSKKNQISPQKLGLYEPHIVAVKCGAYHTIILTTSNHIYICGKNTTGHLGCSNDRDIPQKILLSNIINIHCGKRNNIIITKEYKIYVLDSSCRPLEPGTELNHCDMLQLKI